MKQKHLVFLCRSNEDILFCPVCHSGMKPYDRRKRIMKQYNKETEYLILPRYRCTNKGCNKLHILLPDLLLPHKHYASSIIEETIEDFEDNRLMIPDYPCQETRTRWENWFESCKAQIDAHLKSILSTIDAIGHSILDRTDSLLDILREHGPCWLPYSLSVIYNSGHFLPSIFPPDLPSVIGSLPLMYLTDKEENSHERKVRRPQNRQGCGKVPDDCGTGEGWHRLSPEEGIKGGDSS